MKRLKGNQDGNIMVIVLAATAVVALAAINIMNRSQSGQKVVQQTNVSAVAEQIKATLVGAVMSPQSWQIIQQRNASVFALQNSAGGGSQTTQPSPTNTSRNLNIYLVDSQEPYYASSNPTAGFNMQGQPCSRDQAFNATEGNDLCPFRYNVSLVSHVYQNNAWVDTVRFELQFRPRNLSLVLKDKSDRYTFNLVRNIDENNVAATCRSINGNYNPDTRECSVDLAEDVSCPRGQSYRGSHGTQCVVMRVPANTCASGHAITGFDVEGNPICAPPPTL